MKAKCVSTDNQTVRCTIGKVYEVLVNDHSDPWPLRIIDDVDSTQWVSEKDFELIPDEPAPKSDWMRISEAGYVNMVTGMHICFGINEDVHTAFIGSVCIDNFKSYLRSDGKFADSFAALVGYEWPSAGKEM
jgi:hypothetical protein